MFNDIFGVAVAALFGAIVGKFCRCALDYLTILYNSIFDRGEWIVAATWTRNFLFASVLLAFASPSTYAKPPSTDVAVYIWGGLLDGSFGVARFHRSVAFILDQGFNSVRFSTTRSSGRDYGVSDDSCNDRRASIACYLNQQLDSPVFDDVRLGSLFITMENIEAGTQAANLTDFSAADKTTMRREYDEAFDYLAKRFPRRSFPITILNWEGDNKIFCGAVYRFASQGSFRSSCLAKGDPAKRTRQFIEWMGIRRQAVAAARARHPMLDIRLGYEFNNVGIFSRDCRPAAGACANFSPLITALTKAQGHVPLCSYSAYDSLNHGTAAEDISRLLRTCDRLILGEVGFALKGSNWQSIALKHQAFQKAIAPYMDRIVAIIYWKGFEAAGANDPGYGLYTSAGDLYLLKAVAPSLTGLVPALRRVSDYPVANVAPDPSDLSGKTATTGGRR